MDRTLSLLLDYPSAAIDRVEVAAAAPVELEPFLSWWADAPLTEVERRYVSVFDLDGGNALYLTYHRFGDDRKRGRALIALTRLYREHGWELDHWELPDYLPLVLELAAADPGLGGSVLREYRPELTALADALHRVASPWALVVDHVAAEVAAAELVA